MDNERSSAEPRDRSLLFIRSAHANANYSQLTHKKLLLCNVAGENSASTLNSTPLSPIPGKLMIPSERFPLRTFASSLRQVGVCFPGQDASSLSVVYWRSRRTAALSARNTLLR
jgi:hypothetical protein